MKKWILHTKRADFEAIGQSCRISPVTARIIRNRDVETLEEVENYLYGTKQQFFDPWLLKDCKKTVDILCDKITNKRKIRIIGDYDIDGVCATYILYQGLMQIGADVDFSIPERIKDGYGLNDRLVDDAATAGVDTIITCDNGIAAASQTARAKQAGMTVLITDHHDVPYEEKDGEKRYLFPEADAVVNPKQSDCPYPFKKLCGAAVAWKLITALYQKMGRTGEADQFLTFAAIATVGDVMDLQGENRILVKEGLRSLKSTKNLGLLALISVNQLLDADISAYHIGFVLGPCLNASGRLFTAKRAVDLFLAATKEEADKAAWDLKNYNENRKELTVEWTNKAFELIERSLLINDKVLLVFLPDCHESLAGIIAGRIREKYYRPVLVFTRTEEGVKASGRSIESYNMFEELLKCSDLFDKFGGHPMAAGLSMPEENLETLRQRLNKNAELTAEDLTEKLYIDVALPLEYISEAFIAELKLLEPFGKGNAKPCFAERHLQIMEMRRIGREQNMLRLKVSNGRRCMDALMFQNAENFLTFLTEEFGAREVEKAFHGLENKIDIAFAYYPDVNEYGGSRFLQIVVQDYCRIQ